MMKQYAPALKHIADIIEKGIREHPGKTLKFERNQKVLVYLPSLFKKRRQERIGHIIHP